jgi:hypothetical protein
MVCNNPSFGTLFLSIKVWARDNYSNRAADKVAQTGTTISIPHHVLLGQSKSGRCGVHSMQYESVDEKKNSYTILVGKLERKRLLHRRKNVIKIIKTWDVRIWDVFVG